MLKDLNNRFDTLFDPSQDDHEPVYAVATLLDPRYNMMIITVFFTCVEISCDKSCMIS